MKTISWIEISSDISGGVLYNRQAREALSQEFDLELLDVEAKYLTLFRPLKFLESMWRLMKLHGERDIWARNFFGVLSFPFDKTQGKQIVLRHHSDFSGFSLYARPIFFLLDRIFLHNAKRMDAIVTVSDYWKRYYVEKGLKNVHTIYNGFDLSQFDISEKAVEEFKVKHGLTGKPIIYLGNCQKGKGADKAYAALKGMDAHLITSGRRHMAIPAKNLELEYRDYLTLLKASDVVLAMSKFKEGWCRSAHEAMLLGTPVIGSGSGGMRELLEGGKQIICEDFTDLRKQVEYILLHPEVQEEMAARGRAFTKEFTLERFRRAWIQFAKQLT